MAEMEKRQQNVVIALIRNGLGQILISKRNDSHVPKAHNKWALIGGKIEYGENPIEALIREVKEETGLTISDIKLLPQLFSQFWKNKDGNEFQVILMPYECNIHPLNQEPMITDNKIKELKFIHSAEAEQYNFLPLDIDMIKLLH